MCGTFQMSILMWTQLNLYDACRRERWVGAPRSCDSTCPPKSLRVPALHMNISCVTVMFSQHSSNSISNRTCPIMDRAAIARLTMVELFQLMRLCLEEMMRRTDAAPPVRTATIQVPGTPEPSPGTPDLVPSCNWYCSSPFCEQRCQQRDPLHVDHLCPSHRHWRD